MTKEQLITEVAEYATKYAEPWVQHIEIFGEGYNPLRIRIDNKEAFIESLLKNTSNVSSEDDILEYILVA